MKHTTLASDRIYPSDDRIFGYRLEWLYNLRNEYIFQIGDLIMLPGEDEPQIIENLSLESIMRELELNLDVLP